MTSLLANRKAALTLAWSLVKSSALSFADAQRAAWKAIRLKAKLSVSAAVDFAYRKVDGTIRTARGTRMVDYVSTTTLADNGLTVRYFDLDVSGWRSCRADLIL